MASIHMLRTLAFCSLIVGIGFALTGTLVLAVGGSLSLVGISPLVCGLVLIGLAIRTAGTSSN
jgi:hypothetical protein